jgi:hypothetical protein
MRNIAKRRISEQKDLKEKEQTEGASRPRGSSHVFPCPLFSFFILSHVHIAQKITRAKTLPDWDNALSPPE